MAQIHIERKIRQKPVWPWLLLLLVVLGIVAWLMLADDSAALKKPDTNTEINYFQESPGTVVYAYLEKGN